MQQNSSQSIFVNFSASVMVLIGVIAVISSLALIIPQLGEDIFQKFIFSSQGFMPQEWYRLITYAVLHADFAHLAMNMLWLWIFATSLDRHFGKRTWLIVFLVGVMCGAIIYLGSDSNIQLVGASAGVSACMGASMRFMLRPSFDLVGRVQLYRLTDGRFLLPSIIFLMIDMANSFLIGFINGEEHQISWQSHIVGYCVGAFLMELRFMNHGALKRVKLIDEEQPYP